MHVGTTITISRETKALLEALKGDKTWDEFLREIAEEIMRKRREEARRELARLLEAEEVEKAKWSRY